MTAEFFCGHRLPERDRIMIGRLARAFGVSVSTYIAWAVRQSVDAGTRAAVMAKDFQPPPEPRPEKCSVDECPWPQKAIGLCSAHLSQHYRGTFRFSLRNRA